MSIRTGQGRNLLFAVINTPAASGDFGIVPAPSGVDAGKKIKVVSYCLSSSAGLSVQWKSGTVPITGSMRLASAGINTISIAAEPNSHILETAINSTLTLNVNNPNSVGGHLSYFLEPAVTYS